MATTRRKFLYGLTLTFAAIVVGGVSLLGMKGFKNKLTKEELLSLREKLKYRKRRIILNNDGNDRPAPPVSGASFLASRTIGLEYTQVDTIFYCTGVFNLYTHNSKESEIFSSKEKQWCHQLIDQGRDSLETMIDWCHLNDREIFWSMRMNDTHDSGDDKLLSHWKKQHPAYLIGKKVDFFPHGNFRWSSLNYNLKQVRDKVFAILQDVCSRYDIDGVELDFFRHPIFFEATMQGDEANASQRELISSMMRKIRKMVDKIGMERGCPILVGIRIPDSLEYCSALGLDVKKWLKEDLVDILVTGDYFKLEPWQRTVELGNKYDIPVYACLERRRLVEKSKINDSGYLQKVFRGEAYNALKAGMDGICLFNEFNPHNPVLNELGDIERLSNLERIDQTSYVRNLWSRPEVWLSTASKYFRGGDLFDTKDAVIENCLIPFRHRQKFFYKRKVIYNNDGNENLTNVEVTPQSFLDNRTTGLENSNISSIFYCTGLTVCFSHETRIGARFGYGTGWEDRKNFPVQLDKFDTDSLTLQINYARKHHKEIFWSMRMNDSHDSSLKGNLIQGTWKEAHPDCLMGKPGESFPFGGKRWSSLDYSNASVREFIFKVIEEVADNYDVDGIELDFFRHPIYFKEVIHGGVASEKSIHQMNELIENIRRMTERVSRRRGRPLLIAIRIPDSLEYCKAIGLDVGDWLTNDWIDMIIGGDYFQLQPWKNLVDIGREYHVPVYACNVRRRIVEKDKDNDESYFIKRLRGAALDAWDAGVDGIYTYNLWYNQHSDYKNLFTELGDPELIRNLDYVGGSTYVNKLNPPNYWLKNGKDFLGKE